MVGLLQSMPVLAQDASPGDGLAPAMALFLLEHTLCGTTPVDDCNNGATCHFGILDTSGNVGGDMTLRITIGEMGDGVVVVSNEQAGVQYLDLDHSGVVQAIAIKGVTHDGSYLLIGEIKPDYQAELRAGFANNLQHLVACSAHADPDHLI